MKDAYSFHTSRESLDETYEPMREAYSADLSSLCVRPRSGRSRYRQHRRLGLARVHGPGAVGRGRGRALPELPLRRERREGHVEVLRRRGRAGAGRGDRGAAHARHADHRRRRPLPRQADVAAREDARLRHRPRAGDGPASAATAKATRSRSRTTSARRCWRCSREYALRGRRPAGRSATAARSERSARAFWPTSRSRARATGSSAANKQRSSISTTPIPGRDFPEPEYGDFTTVHRGRPLRPLRHGARDLSRHRSRPHLQARHEVLRGDELRVPRRERASASR